MSSQRKSLCMDVAFNSWICLLGAWGWLIDLWFECNGVIVQSILSVSACRYMIMKLSSSSNGTCYEFPVLEFWNWRCSSTLALMVIPIQKIIRALQHFRMMQWSLNRVKPAMKILWIPIHALISAQRTTSNRILEEIFLLFFFWLLISLVLNFFQYEVRWVRRYLISHVKYPIPMMRIVSDVINLVSL